MINNVTLTLDLHGILESIIPHLDVGDCVDHCLDGETLMAKLTKKAKFKKIKSMAKYHGEIVVIFQDGFGRLRRRKVNKTGHCYVSYKDMEGRWTEYSTSCFILDVRGRTLSETIKRMEQHDRGSVDPVEVVTKKRVVKL